jgi:transmembrane sensor
MDYSKYATYTLQNFLDDDFFIQWVINPGEETDLFWNSVIDQFPDKKGTISQAAQIITRIPFITKTARLWFGTG